MIEGMVFDVHKSILIARSDVFEALLTRSQMQESATNMQVIPDIRPKVMKEVLRFIYTGEVEDIDEIGFELLAAADRFLMPQLKSMAADSVIRSTFSRDALKLLAVGSFFNSVDLVEYGIKKVMASYTRTIHLPEWEDFVRSQPELMLRICEKLVPGTNDSDWD